MFSLSAPKQLLSGARNSVATHRASQRAVVAQARRGQLELDGTISDVEARRYTPEQLEFLQRKRGQAKQQAAPSGLSASAAPASGQYTPEQLEFLKRKLENIQSQPSVPGSQRGRSVQPSRPTTATPSSQYSPEQQAFLNRKRTESPARSAPAPRGRTASPKPAARPAPRPSSASPRRPSSRPTNAAAAASTPVDTTKYSPEQLAFLARKGAAPAASISAAAPAAQAAGKQQYSKEQLEFLARKKGQASSGAVQQRSAGSAEVTRGEAAQYSPEQLEFLRRKRSGY